MHVPYKFSSLWVHRALRTMQARHTKWCDTLCATQWGAKKKQSRTRLCLNDFEGGFARHFCAHWQRGCWISIFCWPCVACTSCNRSLETVAHPSAPSANDHSTACPCPAPRRLCTGRCSQLSWERSPRPPASSSSAQATHHCWLFWNGRSLLSQPSASLQMARRRSHLYVTICVCGFLHHNNAALTSNHVLGPHNMLVRHLLPWKTCSHHPRHWQHFGIRFQRRTNWPYCTRTCPWCGQLHRFQISNLTKLQWMILQLLFSQLLICEIEPPLICEVRWLSWIDTMNNDHQSTGNQGHGCSRAQALVHWTEARQCGAMEQSCWNSSQDNWCLHNNNNWCLNNWCLNNWCLH